MYLYSEDQAFRIHEQVSLSAANLLTSVVPSLFAPTLVGTVYGMNFQYMPELSWTLGYPFALMLMLAVSVSPLRASESNP